MVKLNKLHDTRCSVRALVCITLQHDVEMQSRLQFVKKVPIHFHCFFFNRKMILCTLFYVLSLFPLIKRT